MKNFNLVEFLSSVWVMLSCCVFVKSSPLNVKMRLADFCAIVLRPHDFGSICWFYLMLIYGDRWKMVERHWAALEKPDSFDIWNRIVIGVLDHFDSVPSILLSRVCLEKLQVQSLRCEAVEGPWIIFTPNRRKKSWADVGICCERKNGAPGRDN